MVELSLMTDEYLIISSYAQLQELKFFSQLKTGQAFLTDKRFIFKGRLQIKGLWHLFAMLMKKGKRDFEIPIYGLINVKKRRSGNEIEITYLNESKKRKILLKPEKIRYVGAILGLGLGIFAGEIGERLGHEIFDKTGKLIGREIGEEIGKEGNKFVKGKVDDIQAKNLNETWLKAFQYKKNFY
jgi:hypothetical protein